MGASCSCPLSAYFDLQNGFESVALKSITLRDDDDEEEEAKKTAANRSFLYNDKDSDEPTALLSLGSEEGSVRFRPRNTQTMRFSEEHKCMSPLDSPFVHPNSPKDEAAIKLQKVYKSFRTRRKLADCAVLIEQSWWKLLDFAELKHSSISFFDLDKHETAMSRWSRARTRAAKVGKGLSKNGKAQKLALQHWLEAIDPRHRYGHNLHFYYMKWLNSQSKEPFFYWLDIGEGKEVNLIDKCPRSKLHQQCIKYLGPMERGSYEVSMEDGKLFYKQTGELLNTLSEPKGCKWIFVLSTSRVLYVGKKMKGSFQHSSFLAGGATLAAGRILAESGVLKAVWPHSGHYRPTAENFQDLISFLKENNVDLTDVKLEPIDDDEESVAKNGSLYLRSNSSEEDLSVKDQLAMEENRIQNKIDPAEVETAAAVEEVPSSKRTCCFTGKLATLKIPSNYDVLEQFTSETDESYTSNFPLESPMDGYETAAQETLCSSFQVNTMFEEDQNESKVDEIIPEESIFQRINSHKRMKSFQLGKQLSCRWSTGAGPRIGCLRDYPPGLQSHALEEVNLSPRSQRRLRFDSPSRASTPNSSSLSRSCSQPVEILDSSRYVKELDHMHQFLISNEA